MRTLAVILLTIGCSTPQKCNDCQRGLTFTQGPDLPAALDHHATVAVNGFLYVIGGNDYKKQYPDVWFAHIEADGSLGQWNATTPLPVARAGHGVAVVRDRIVVLSGQGRGKFFTSVLSAPIQGDGTLGAWEAEPDLPAARFHSYVAQTADALYVTGGVDSHFDATTTLYRAAVENGRLGSFSSAGELPVARSHHAALIRDGKLWIAGGLTGNPTGNSHDLAEILSAPIQTDGSLGSFSTVGMLEDPPATLSGFELDGDWYLAGGIDDAGHYLDDLRRIRFSDGAIIVEEMAAALPVGRSHVHQTPVVGDHLYSVGGSIDYQTLTPAVQIGKFAWVPKTAMLPRKKAMALGPRKPHCSIDR